MKTGLNIIKDGKIDALPSASESLDDIIDKFNSGDPSIAIKLKEIDVMCNEIMNNSTEQNAGYAVNVLKDVCSDISALKLAIVPDRPHPGFYSYEGKLLRDIEAIAFKLDLLADKYFVKSYAKYSYINSASSCCSEDKVYELVDELRSDRRAMVEIVSSMLSEIQGLGITPNPVSLQRSETEDPLLHTPGNSLPGK